MTNYIAQHIILDNYFLKSLIICGEDSEY